MKRVFLFFMLLAISMPLFAQTVDPGSVEISQYFVSLAVFATTVVLVTQFVLKYIKTDKDQLVSWLVSIGLSGVGWIFGLGMFSGLSWYWIFIYGVAAGLVANGIFDIPVVKAILKIIPKKKE